MARNLLTIAGILLALGSIPGGDAGAADRKCLSKEQQRSAVGSGKAVPLATAIRASSRRNPGEVVRAELCQEPSGELVYLLTVLARNGKVTRTVVDAEDGAVANGK